MSRARFFKQILRDTARPASSPPTQPVPASWPADTIVGSVLGHSTVLLKVFGFVILTDPVFSARVGPGVGPFVLGPKRYLKPALRPRQIPRPDLILLSHAHFDHLDRRSLRHFRRDTPVVTARATTDLLKSLGFSDVRELDWLQSAQVECAGGQVKVTALPVAHWGARMLKDHHRGYNGYLLEREGYAVCFAGDTAYTPHFSSLNRPGARLDLMLCPIGAYDPWIRAHCSPEQAAAMARQAGAQHFVPIHHQTFKLSSEPMDEPARRIQAAFAQEPGKLLATDVGQTFWLPISQSEARPRYASSARPLAE